MSLNNGKVAGCVIAPQIGVISRFFANWLENRRSRGYCIPEAPKPKPPKEHYEPIHERTRQDELRHGHEHGRISHPHSPRNQPRSRAAGHRRLHRQVAEARPGRVYRHDAASPAENAGSRSGTGRSPRRRQRRRRKAVHGRKRQEGRRHRHRERTPV